MNYCHSFLSNRVFKNDLIVILLLTSHFLQICDIHILADLNRVLKKCTKDTKSYLANL